MKARPAVLRIRRTRRMLNARIALSFASRAGAAGLVLAAAVSAALILSGLADRPAALGLSSTLGAAGLLLGLLLSRRALCDDRQAASWLDRGLGDKGLFAAALACHERRRLGSAGPWDDALAARADEAVRSSTALRVPPPYALRPLVLLAGALLLFASTLLLPSPRAKAPGEGIAPVGKTFSFADPTSESAQALLAEAAAAPDPEELARSLFPDRPELADLLADALRDGRLADAGKILDRAELARTQLKEDRSLGTGNPDARPVHERLRDVIRQAGEGGGATDEERTERGQDGGSGTERVRAAANLDAAPMDSPDAGSGGSGQSAAGDEGAAGNGPGGSGGGGTESGPEDGRAEPGVGDKPKAAAAGVGSGASRDWGPIDPSATGGDLGIRPLDGSSYFEMILPEDGSGLSALERVVASSRTAEEAIARLSLPAEYEESIRAYFTMLNREAAAAGP